MIEPATFLTFLAACFALVLAPGPSPLIVVVRSLSEGARSGAMTALGLNIGTYVHAGAAALGLPAVLATSALAFSIVKYVGVVLRTRTRAAASERATGWRKRISGVTLIGLGVRTAFQQR